MNKVILYIALLCPLIINAQVESANNGILWMQGLSLEQAKQKAKAENKYIFLDCYATWCGPCKKMDKEIYPNDTVGNYFNEKFISVRVQMDSSKDDDDGIKGWYADANKLTAEYKIDAFPTLLFFSPTGEFIQKVVGYKNVKDLVSTGQDVLNPDKQYSTLFNRYKNGTLSISLMSDFAKMASSIGRSELTRELNSKCVLHLLNSSDEKLYTKSNIEFIRTSIQFSTDTGFAFFYRNVKRLNKVMENPNYAQSFIRWIISKEEVDPILVPATKTEITEPDWSHIYSATLRKYEKKYADEVLIDGKMRWYEIKGNKPLISYYTALKLKKFGKTVSDFDIMSNTWTIFSYSNKEWELKVAAKWIKKVINKQSDNDPNKANAMDTYANLLFKLGKSKKRYLAIEEKAAKLAPNKKDIQIALTKMKKNEPTWE